MPSGKEQQETRGSPRGGGGALAGRGLSPDGRAGPMLEASPTRAPSDRLPPGWEAKCDARSGKYFYVNHALRIMRWARLV
jgi:hypothetical protein